MGKPTGPGLGTGLLVSAVCLLFMSALLPGIQAYDYAEILIPGHAGWRMEAPDVGEDRSRLGELIPWWKDDGESTWACSRCGERDNIACLGGCLQCGYAESNPEGYLLMPVGKAIITGGYSDGHRAADFGVPEGTPVLAAGDGTVAEVVENDRSRGTVLKLAHGDGVETLYGHLGEILVPLGGYVRMGEVVALSGNTGASTGPHLHFEVHADGEADDPFHHLGFRQ